MAVTAAGVIISEQIYGEKIDAGQVAYLKSDGKWYLARANSAVTSAGDLAIALDSGVAGGKGRLVKLGYVNNTAWSWTPGAPLYLSAATAGGLTQTRPTGAGNVEGLAADAGDIIVGDDGAWTKIAAGDAGKILASNGAGSLPRYPWDRVARTATYVVAASDAPAHVKRRADYVCDGTDDQVEIQAAIDALTAGRSVLQTVTLVGTFTIAAPITIAHYTHLDLTAAKLVGTAASAILYATDGNSVRITGGEIDCDDVATYGIELDRILDARIEGVTVRNAATNCVHLVKCPRPRITGCVIDGAAAHGVYLYYCGIGNLVTGGSFNDSLPPIVDGCFVSNNGKYGLYSNASHDLHVCNCSFERNGAAAVTDDGGGVKICRPIESTIIGNNFEYNARETGQYGLTLVLDDPSGFGFSSGSINVVGNLFQGEWNNIGIVNVPPGYPYGINIAANMFLTTDWYGLHIRGPTATTLINVTANQIRYGTPGANKRAIVFEREDGSGTDASGVVIFGNQIYGPKTAIELGTDITGAQIVENTFRNTTTPISYGTGASATVKRNRGYVTESQGAAASITDGGTIAHRCAATPTVATVSGSVAGEIVTVTSIDATNITVAIKKPDGSAGTAQTVYWRAEV